MSGALAAQHLVELLAVVSSCDDEQSAIRAAVERAAETVEAEVCCFVADGSVVAAVGLPAGSPDYADLVAPAAGRGWQELPGLGLCGIGWAHLGRPDEGTLLVARAEDEFTVAEHNLIRGMARVLGLTLGMLRTLAAERRREKLMRNLYDVQRLISRRAPLAEVLRATLSAAADVLAADVELCLIDPDGGCQAMVSGGAMVWEIRTLAADSLSAAAIAADRPQEDAGGMAVSVHEGGRVVGALGVRLSGRGFDDPDRSSLLSFAEHISLALTDARTVQDMNAARHDALTGLASRALFRDRLTQLLAAAIPGTVALLYIDLDRFKAVNDSMGHAAGDVLLTAVAQRLTAMVRQSDLVGRLGGDEFAIVLTPASRELAAEVAGRVIQELTRPVPLPGGGVAEVGASVGIALNISDDLDELIAQADIAMFSAKRAGRGRFAVARSEDRNTRMTLRPAA